MHCIYTKTGAFDHLTWKAAVTDVFSTPDGLLAAALNHVMSTRTLHKTVLHCLIHDLSLSNAYAGITITGNVIYFDSNRL